MATAAEIIEIMKQFPPNEPVLHQFWTVEYLMLRAGPALLTRKRAIALIESLEADYNHAHGLNEVMIDKQLEAAVLEEHQTLLSPPFFDDFGNVYFNDYYTLPSPAIQWRQLKEQTGWGAHVEGWWGAAFYATEGNRKPILSEIVAARQTFQSLFCDQILSAGDWGKLSEDVYLLGDGGVQGRRLAERGEVVQVIEVSDDTYFIAICDEEENGNFNKWVHKTTVIPIFEGDEESCLNL